MKGSPGLAAGCPATGGELDAPGPGPGGVPFGVNDPFPVDDLGGSIDPPDSFESASTCAALSSSRLTKAPCFNTESMEEFNFDETDGPAGTVLSGAVGAVFALAVSGVFTAMVSTDLTAGASGARLGAARASTSVNPRMEANPTTIKVRRRNEFENFSAIAWIN